MDEDQDADDRQAAGQPGTEVPSRAESPKPEEEQGEDSTSHLNPEAQDFKPGNSNNNDSEAAASPVPGANDASATDKRTAQTVQSATGVATPMDVEDGEV